MTYAMLIEKAKVLPEESILKLSEYIDFLLFEMEKSTMTTTTDHPKRTIGQLEGKLKYMAPDFDAPIEFKEYKSM